mmetsp:Transcript_32367/g.58037  ORF Transcript_32367/g.58037 Transcript_32367/m.58037 type:complete len:216 (+) Transcript_32367:588-1235(+)
MIRCSRSDCCALNIGGRRLINAPLAGSGTAGTAGGGTGALRNVGAGGPASAAARSTGSASPMVLWKSVDAEGWRSGRSVRDSDDSAWAEARALLIGLGNAKSRSAALPVGDVAWAPRSMDVTLSSSTAVTSGAGCKAFGKECLPSLQWSRGAVWCASVAGTRSVNNSSNRTRPLVSSLRAELPPFWLSSMLARLMYCSTASFTLGPLRSNPHATT